VPVNSGTARNDKARMHERAGRVFVFLDELIEALPVPSNYRKLLQVQVGQTNSWQRSEMLATQLPLLVHEAVTGDERPALPVAAACTLLYLGADLFDSMLDHELPPSWHARSSVEANLAATTLLAALPHLSITRLQEQGTPPAKLWALAQLFADTLLTMSAGQYEDLLFPNLESVSLEDSLVMVERKSGSAGALLARTGAVLATEDTFTIETYAAIGSCFGIVKQLVNDVGGIWGEGASQDLSNGKRTLPILHALSTLRGERRKRLQKLLVAARETSEPHDEVRALLAAAGSVRYTTLIMWLYQEQARSHLAAASPQEPAGRELRKLLDLASLLTQPEEE
jgi:geranylgeranyl diphosphate synthase type I